MENQTIIVKKIKKGGHGHHGGAWKVAFADFAVAMMAFFLLLWLIASTTKEEQAGLSEYFSPPTQGLADGSGKSEDIIDMGGGQKISQGDDSKQDAREPTADKIREIVEADKRKLESLMQELKMAIENNEALKPFKDQLLLDIVPDGLRIQIVDKEGRPMFDSGKASLKPYSRKILREIAKVINTVPNKLSLTGHTDATRFVSRKGYSNWELSADRANASRRELVAGGYDIDKIAKVVGLSSMLPFDPANPNSPINRRIAIVILNKAAEQALLNPLKTALDAEEAAALIEGDAGDTGERRFRGVIGERRKRESAERVKQESSAPKVAPQEPEQVARHEPVPAAESAAKAEAETNGGSDAQPERPSGPIPVINPIPGIEPIQAVQPINKSPADIPKPAKKPAKTSASKPLGDAPDYTGMSISERIKARAAWNKRKSAQKQ